MKKFRAGALAPDFVLPSDTGEPTSLSSHRGKPTVLYFICKAGSPGCAEQASALKSVAKRFGLNVVGVAPDSPRKIANFRKKLRLPFTLLSDADNDVGKLYGVWIKKFAFGHHFVGMERVTLVLDARGKIVKTISGMTPKEHAAEVARHFSVTASASSRAG
jgi:thioredoxin-dependent peroxiredoxin